MIKFKLKRYACNVLFAAGTLIRWLLTAVLTGVIVGGICTFFAFVLLSANDFRKLHPLIIGFLPVAGLVIVLLYKNFQKTDDLGTNLIISSIRTNTDIPFRMAPMIFISTTLTQLFGGSAGREGAAIQLGGCLANKLGRIFHLNENDQHIIIMCGMSAGFSAIFGTPMAAAIFSLEVISVGIMHYSALVPCVISSFTAHFIALYFKIPPEHFPVPDIPAVTAAGLGKMILFGAIIGVISILFCMGLHYAEVFYKKFLDNAYYRIAAGGLIIVGLSAVLQTEAYLGSGVSMLTAIFEEGHIVGAEAFFLKIVFTTLTIAAGFKGGEIVPSFCIGGAFGCAAASLLNLPVPLVAACGMAGLFCGVTNCPMTSLLISFELFGFEGMPYYLITVAVSYMLSGYYGLYQSQKIMYSKYHTQYVHKQTHH